MSKAPSRSQDQFIVRLPDGMRDRIKAAADRNGRSMNAEIVQVLEDHFPERSGDEMFFEAASDLAAALDQLAKETTNNSVLRRITEANEIVRQIWVSLDRTHAEAMIDRAKKKDHERLKK